jgi:hypothetical protein
LGDSHLSNNRLGWADATLAIMPRPVMGAMLVFAASSADSSLALRMPSAIALNILFRIAVRKTQRLIVDPEEGQGELASFMLQRLADRVSHSQKGGRSTVHFQFDH